MSKEQYLVQHGERKEKLLTLLHDVQTFMTAQGKEGDAQALEKLQNNIEQGLFSIVLIGEFSAGKSTFLNALMQKRILPSYTRETTATVNFLQHASKAPNGEPGIVYYRDGRTEVLPDLSVDTLTKYVTVGEGEKRNAVSESTERVDLFLASRFLEDGVMLVDSPGLNGITENLEDITRRQIKESHASIFMFSADRPGSKTDFDTLRDLREQCSRIFIVLNKIDAIKANEGESVESVVQHLKDSYAEQRSILSLHTKHLLHGMRIMRIRGSQTRILPTVRVWRRVLVCTPSRIVSGVISRMGKKHVRSLWHPFIPCSICFTMNAVLWIRALTS